MIKSCNGYTGTRQNKSKNPFALPVVNPLACPWANFQLGTWWGSECMY